jgi:hypothetical protein
MAINVAPWLAVAFAAITLPLMLHAAPAMATACIGPDPAIVSVGVKGMQSSGGLDRYTLSARVVNLGSTAQASNTLQFVNIYKGSTKLDSRGVPPLRAGQSYTFHYISDRSAQAGAQTTTLGFRMDVREPPNTGSQPCNASNGVTMVRF